MASLLLSVVCADANQVSMSVSMQCVVNEHAVPSLLQHGMQHNPTRVHHSFTRENAASAHLPVQTPLAFSDPLVACHPCQTTWAFTNHYVKPKRRRRIILSESSGPKRIILLHLSSRSHHDTIVCFFPKSPVGLTYRLTTGIMLC